MKPQLDITDVLLRHFEPWNPLDFKGSPSWFHHKGGVAFGDSSYNRARALLVASCFGDKEAKKDADGRTRKRRKRVGGSQAGMSVAAARKKADKELRSISPGEIEKLAAQRRSDVGTEFGQWSLFAGKSMEEQQQIREEAQRILDEKLDPKDASPEARAVTGNKWSSFASKSVEEQQQIYEEAQRILDEKLDPKRRGGGFLFLWFS